MRITLGEYIRRKRRDRRMSLQELSNKVELSYGHASRIENDQATPSLETLTRLSTALGAPLKEMLELTASQPAEILKRILEEQSRPAAALRRRSGALSSEGERARALVENMPSALVSALAKWASLPEGDALALASLLGDLAGLSEEERDSIAAIVGHMARREEE